MAESITSTIHSRAADPRAGGLSPVRLAPSASEMNDPGAIHQRCGTSLPTSAGTYARAFDDASSVALPRAHPIPSAAPFGTPAAASAPLAAIVPTLFCWLRPRLTARWGLPTLASVLLLCGCGKFFNPPTTTTTTTTTTPTTTTSDFLYVANDNPSLNTIAGFSLASGGITTTTSSPYVVSATPAAVALTPDNSLLYVASSLAGGGGIYVYTVNTNGSLSVGNGGTAVASAVAQSIIIDPSGGWLIALQDQVTGSAPIASVFAINTSTGVLTQQGSSIALDGGSAEQLFLVPGTSPNYFVYAALGSEGVDALTFDTATGALSKLNVHLNTLGNAYSDNGLASDPTGAFLYVGETGANAVRSFTINTDGTLSELSGSPTSAATGGGALLVESTGSYLYSADPAASTISAFSIGTTGALTALATPKYTTGTAPEAMVEDSTNSYLAVACSGGTPDLDVFPISTTGALGTPLTASTGTPSPAIAYAIAASH